MRLMQLTMTTLAVAGKLVSLAIAKPIQNWKAGGIAIPLTRHLPSDENIDLRDSISSHGMLVEEKIRSALDNYEMNTGTMHPFAIKRTESKLGARGDFDVPLTTDQNAMWMGEISIGTPPKTLKVQIDTGSSYLWVLETGCSGISSSHNFWDPFASDSAEYQGKPFQVAYTYGTTVTGALYTDNVTIDGFTADPQTFGSATSLDFQLLTEKFEYPADGLLGLAFPSISKFGVDPLFLSLFKQKRLIDPIFSLKLSSPDAEMYIGGTNKMLYNGDIAYTPVANSGLWQVSMDEVRVNGKIIFINVPAVFDSGANYIFGDRDQVSELYRHIGGQVDEHKGHGYYYLPCDHFPTISLVFGGKTFEIPPEALKLKPLAQGSPLCFSAIIARDGYYPFWSMGIPFLQTVYSVFDYGTAQVGFANLA